MGLPMPPKDLSTSISKSTKKSSNMGNSKGFKKLKWNNPKIMN